MNWIVGNVYSNIICESFKDPETGRIRVKPLDIEIPVEIIVIECSKRIRDSYPVGTKFLAEELKVCKKSNGRIYLRAKNQMIYKII